MFNGYVMVGIEHIQDEDSGSQYTDKYVLGISDSEQSMDAISDLLIAYDEVLTQLWYYDTLIQTKKYSRAGVELTYSLVNQLQNEIEEAKSVIVTNTKVLNDLGLL